MSSQRGRLKGGGGEGELEKIPLREAQEEVVPVASLTLECWGGSATAAIAADRTGIL